MCLREGPLVMSGLKINDPQFLVLDMVDHDLNRALRLSSGFSLSIQAIYTHFHPDFWDKFSGMDLLEHQRIVVNREISVSFTCSLLDLHSLMVDPWISFMPLFFSFLYLFFLVVQALEAMLLNYVERNALLR